MRSVHGRRRWLIGSLVGLLALAAIAGGSGFLLSRQAPRLVGTSLGNEPAPDFRLRDSSGQAHSLSEFRGKVVVLAFLYTQCPDACPITAELLRKADAAAGHRPDVEYVALSVDPFHDNAATIATFSQEHHLEELGNRFHYLIGDLSELAPVWQRYYIREGDAPTAGQDISHVSSLYFIDKHGRRRLLTHIDVSPEDVARNERVLAK